jgi:hypothetical protein
MLSDLVYRLRAPLRRNTVEAEMDVELRFHIERHVEKYVRAGPDRREAQRRARMESGEVESVKEQCRDARGVRGRSQLCSRVARVDPLAALRCD